METLGILLVVGLIGFLLIGVPMIAISSRNHSVQTRALIEPLTAQIARLQQQIDGLRTAASQAGQPATGMEPVPPSPAQPVRSAAKRRVTGSTVTARLATAPAMAGHSSSVPPPLPPAMAAAIAVPPPFTAAVPVASSSPPKKDFEELIGTRWAIWVGGLALALGSLFLVRYTIEAGYFGPSARLFLGASFSILLAACGELLRRGTILPRRLAELPVEHAPLALTAAGTIGLFGTVYAAYAVYGFMPQTVAFVLLGIIGVMALAASLLHGQALAGIGLVASYATPVLIGGDSSSRWPLVAFLLAVTAAGMAVQNRLRTAWLGWAVISGVALWSTLLIGAQKAIPVAELTLLVASMGIFAAAFCWLRKPELPTTRSGDLQPIVALAGLAAALGLSFVVHPGEPGLYVVFGLAAVAVVAATSATDGRAALAMVAAALLPLGMVLTWPAVGSAGPWGARVLDGAFLIVTSPPRAPGTMGLFALGSAVLLAAMPLAVFFRFITPRGASAASGLMAVAISGGLAAPLLALAWAWRSEGLTQNFPAAAILAVLFAGLALVTRALLATRTDEDGAIASGGYGAGAALALGLAIALALPGLWMAVGFSLAALATAALNDRKPLPMLRRVTAAFSTTALLRAVTAPVIQPEAALPILNSYLVAYGLPVLLLAAAAFVLSRQNRDRSLRTTGLMAGLMAALFAAYEIRHAFHGRDLVDRFGFGLGESGLYALACTLTCLVIFGLRNRIGAQEHERLRTVIAAINGVALILVILLPLFLATPWLQTRISGPAFVDSTFVGFLLPAISLGALAFLGRTHPDGFQVLLTNTNRIFAIMLGYLYVVAQTRRAFVGTDQFNFARVGDVEHYAYSAVTLLFGVVLLIIGFRLASRETRLASAFFVILAVVKVFLFDMAELTGLLRALSFIGLGGVLIGIGLAYQRLLFDRKARPVSEQTASLAPNEARG